MSYQPIAPNRIAVVRQAAEECPVEFKEAHRDGLPPGRREAFIRIVARHLFESDPRFGLNGKRGTSTVSQDAISFKTAASPAGGVEIIDVIVAAGSDAAAPGWNDVTQKTADLGHIGMWIKPQPLAAPPPPPSPPPPDQRNKFSYFREDLAPFFRGEVPAHQMFDALITRVRTEAGLDIKEEDWERYRALAFWRYGNQTLLRSTRHRSHDSAMVFSPNPEGYVDLEAQLLDVWKPAGGGNGGGGGGNGGDQPFPDLLAIPLRDRITNFLYDQANYFSPAAAAKGWSAFRRMCAYQRSIGSKLVLVNMEQKHWGPSRGEASWTGPQEFPSFFSDAKVDVFIEMLKVARREFGLWPVVGFVEQDRLKEDFNSVKQLAETYLPLIRPWCVALWTSWEVGEVINVDTQHELSDIVAANWSKTHGLHFNGLQSGRPFYDPRAEAVRYWKRNRGTVCWAQYGFKTPSPPANKIEFRTNKLSKAMAEAGKGQKVVMAEGSIWGPNVWISGDGHSLAEAAARGEAGIRGGAIARMNG